MRYILGLSFLLLSACSFKPEPNRWQYKASTAFEAYKHDRLEQKTLLAKNDYQRALFHAKQSADFETLASIYLGKCALDRALEVYNGCKEYTQIGDLVNIKRLENYFYMLQKEWEKVDPDSIDARYEPFVKAMQKRDYSAANNALKHLKDPVSKLLALSLLKEHATLSTLYDTLDLLSFYGYKAGVVVVLRKLLQKEKDKTKKAVLERKLRLLRE